MPKFMLIYLRQEDTILVGAICYVGLLFMMVAVFAHRGAEAQWCSTVQIWSGRHQKVQLKLAQADVMNANGSMIFECRVLALSNSLISAVDGLARGI